MCLDGAQLTKYSVILAIVVIWGQIMFRILALWLTSFVTGTNRTSLNFSSFSVN